MTTTVAYAVQAIPADHLDQVRSRGADVAGHPFRPFAATDGAPLRCCLRDAVPGEPIALISYRPAADHGPYAEVGPVFVHAERCAGWSGGAGWPAGLRPRRQVLRGYDAAGDMLPAVLTEPDGFDAGVASLLADPRVAHVHARNVLAGCWNFTITPLGT